MEQMTDVILYLVITLSIVGCIGNSYALIMFIKSKDQRKPATPYLICIALSDVIAICAGTPHLGESLGIPFPVTKVSCGAITYWTYVACFFSSWSIVLSTFERTIAVVQPLRYYRDHTAAKSWTTIRGMTVVALVYHFWILAVIDVIQMPNSIQFGNRTRYHCHIKNVTSAIEAYKVFTTADSVISFGLPMILSLTMNCVMCRQLFKSALARRKLTSQRSYGTLPTVEASTCQRISENTAPETIELEGIEIERCLDELPKAGNDSAPKQPGSCQERRVTLALISISLAFTFLNLPLYLYQILTKFKVVQHNPHISNAFYTLYISQFALNNMFYLIGFHGNLLPCCRSGRGRNESSTTRQRSVGVRSRTYGERSYPPISMTEPQQEPKKVQRKQNTITNYLAVPK